MFILHKKRINTVSIKMVKESSTLYDVRKISSPNDIYNIVKDMLLESDREKLIVCCLSTKNEPINLSVVSVGSINSSIVSPREVFKTAILSNSASIILAHNHPSGDTTPSKEDINITSRIKECGRILGIDLIDHIILGNIYTCNYTSLKEKNYI